jgi:Arc/MetJ-type ribon-helix-helix transcriptional regulator
MKTIIFRLRIEPSFKEKLQKAVAEGKAPNMSQLIRDSVEHTLQASM